MVSYLKCQNQKGNCSASSVGQVLWWGLGAGGSGRLCKGGVAGGLLKIPTPYTRGPPASSGGEGEGGHCGEAGKGWGEVVLGPEDRGGEGTHCHLASLALVPPGPSLALCTAGSVSKDVCLFLDQRFISFHFNCLLLSWACESAGLCYKGEPWPCEPNLAASCMTKSVLWLTGYDLGRERRWFHDFVESGSKPYGTGNLRFSS